ncbi:hypothetical protein M3Y96_00923700 [Aphelenchoides besseyi]|nr:hypothetical protein M3Y96_00923700 [Aphelenchoides besseyi]
MLNRLPDDVLLQVLGYCLPTDVQNASMTCRWLYSFVGLYRSHLPQFTTNCVVNLLNESQIKICLRKNLDSNRISKNISSKQITYMPQINLNETPLLENLNAYRITSLTLYSKGSSVVEVADQFIGWLSTLLKSNLPSMEFVSLKGLNMNDLTDRTWSMFLELCGNNVKFSVTNCSFPRLLMIYDLYKIPWTYLTETYNSFCENNMSSELIRDQNQKLVRHIVEEDVDSTDLFSIQDDENSFVFELISNWIRAKHPHEISVGVWKKLAADHLDSLLYEHENAQWMAGMFAYRNHFHSHLYLVVDSRQRLFLNLCVRSSVDLL